MPTLTLYQQQVDSTLSPTIRGSWDTATTTKKKVLGTTKSGLITSYSEAVTTNANWRHLLQRFISAPLAGDMFLTGTLDGVVGARQSDALVAGYLRLHAFVLVGTTDVLRGTLCTEYVDPDAAGTLATACGEGFSLTMANVQAYNGDTIVVELGLKTSSTSTAYNIRSYNGGTDATDLVDNGDASLYTGWMRFNYTTGAAVVHTLTLLGAGKA